MLWYLLVCGRKYFSHDRTLMVVTSLGRKLMRTTSLKKDVNAIRDIRDIEILWGKYPKATLSSLVRLCNDDAIEKMVNILKDNCSDKRAEIVIRSFSADYSPVKAYYAIDRLIKNNGLYGNVVKKLRFIQKFIDGYRSTVEDLIKTCSYSTCTRSRDGGVTCIKISPTIVREIEQELAASGAKVICAKTILEQMFQTRSEPYLSEIERKRLGMK